MKAELRDASLEGLDSLLSLEVIGYRAVICKCRTYLINKRVQRLRENLHHVARRGGVVLNYDPFGGIYLHATSLPTNAVIS
jgi:hypothetical protein